MSEAFRGSATQRERGRTLCTGSCRDSWIQGTTDPLGAAVRSRVYSTCIGCDLTNRAYMEFKMTDKDETESVESEPQRAAQLADSVDGILDMIDDLLEENAEPFDPSYVQKGGQGWSTFVDPSYL